jgi:hypothetical protein
VVIASLVIASLVMDSRSRSGEGIADAGREEEGGPDRARSPDSRMNCAFTRSLLWSLDFHALTVPPDPKMSRMLIRSESTPLFTR